MPRANCIESQVNNNGCHICISHVPYQNGYHYIKINGKRYAIHRYIYEQNYGEIPEGFVVRHKCDIRSCINPEHLEVGTQAENNRDTMERGRQSFHFSEVQYKGEANHSAVLTEDDIRTIRADSTTPSSVLARNYSVSDVNIYYIRKRITWSHVL